jgi:hypothetical protein
MRITIHEKQNGGSGTDNLRQTLMVVIFYKMYSLSSEIVVVRTTNQVQKTAISGCRGIFNIKGI